MPVAQAASPAAQAWAQRHPGMALQEAALGRERVILLEEWKHREATAETHYRATRTHQGALARLHLSGAINADQLAWACEIAIVYERLQQDVAAHIVKYEPRIDEESRGPIVLAVETVMAVRREQAYGRWEKMLPMPRRLVLDMIVGEPIPFSTAARRFCIGKARARNLLISAIDRWPDCLEWACKMVTKGDVDFAHARLA